MIKYADGELAYILAPQRLKVGDPVVSSLLGGVGTYTIGQAIQDSYLTNQQFNVAAALSTAWAARGVASLDAPVSGGVTGAVGFRHVGFKVTIFFAVFLFALAIRPLVHDLRVRMRMLGGVPDYTEARALARALFIRGR